MTDAAGKPVLAKTKYGKGNLLVGVRGLAGSNPNASDSINYRMWRPLLKAIASGKTIDPAAPFRGKGIGDLEHKEKHETFVLSYSDYLKPFADAMVDISKRCQPMIEARMGVPLSKGMGSEISLLGHRRRRFFERERDRACRMVGRFPRKGGQYDRIYHTRIRAFLGAALS